MAYLYMRSDACVESPPEASVRTKIRSTYIRNHDCGYGIKATHRPKILGGKWDRSSGSFINNPGVHNWISANPSTLLPLSVGERAFRNCRRCASICNIYRRYERDLHSIPPRGPNSILRRPLWLGLATKLKWDCDFDQSMDYKSSKSFRPFR